MGRVRLSPHFDSDEFATDGRRRPPDRFLRWARRLCTLYLEPLRSEFGAVTVHSGSRSGAHNAEVGGAPSSMHVSLPGRRGAAADVSCARGTPREWYRFLDRLGAPGLGLYADHVHVDNREGHARW